MRRQAVALAAAHGAFGALWGGAALTRLPRYHWFVAVATVVLFAIYVAALFAQLK